MMKRLLLTSTMLALCLALGAGVLPAMDGTDVWTAEYYSNPDWQGYPVYTEYVGYPPYLSLDWGTGAPPYAPADYFSARFTMQTWFNTGNWSFSAIADDEIALFLDGANVLDTRGTGMSGKWVGKTVSVTWQGMHTVEVLYREAYAAANIYLTWAWAGGTTPPPPQYPTLPASQSSVVTMYGDYTWCIQNRLHQKDCFQQVGYSPDKGSIEMEQAIESWNYCEPADRDQTYYVSPQVPARVYRCSKTLAGWFPME